MAIKSKWKGVRKAHNSDGYESSMTINNGRKLNIGTYDTELDAAIAWNHSAKKYHKNPRYNDIPNWENIHPIRRSKRNTPSILNKTGIVGVTHAHNYDRFLSKIEVNGEVIQLGSFKILEEAVEARKIAEMKYIHHKQPHICQNDECGKEFFPKKAKAIYCSVACAGVAKRTYIGFICDTCGKKFEVKTSEAKSHNVRFCSNECKYKKFSEERRGAGTPWYKGGYIDSNGYKVITVDRKKYLEHRYIMEQHLGRKLAKNEEVHHLDGDKLNNDINNLIVLSKADHTKLHYGNVKKAGRWNGADK
jgi:hypothetical protein